MILADLKVPVDFVGYGLNTSVTKVIEDVGNGLYGVCGVAAIVSRQREKMVNFR